MTQMVKSRSLKVKLFSVSSATATLSSSLAQLRNYSLDHGNVTMIVKTSSTRGNLHLLDAFEHVPFRAL